MAVAAGSENHISKDAFEAYLDRYEGIEDEAQAIMMKAMKECKDGPRSEQKDLRSEMKGAGVRLKAFNALWAERKAERDAVKRAALISEFEENDLDQLKEAAQAFAGTPFGDRLEALLSG